MTLKIDTSSGGDECESLYDSFVNVFHKVAHDKATPSRLGRLVSSVQNLIRLSEGRDMKNSFTDSSIRMPRIDGDLIGSVIIDCLCCTRDHGTMGTTASPASSSSKAGDNASRTRRVESKGQSSKIILRCMYALSSVLRECNDAETSIFMKCFVHTIVSRLEEIGDAISRIPAEDEYEAQRIKKVLCIWRQEGVLKETSVVKRLLACHSKIYKGTTRGSLRAGFKTRDPLPEHDLFEKRMRSMENATLHVMYMKHPMISCE